MSQLTLSALRIGDFRRLLATRVCGLMALQAQAVIVGWQVYSLTKDPLMLGLVGLAEAIPAIACALFAGHLVDHRRPHRIYLICLSVLALNALMLWVLAGGILHPGDLSVLPWIFLGVFVSGIARAFIMPASFSLLPQIVAREHIPAASAWLSSGFQLAAILGPSLAGLIYAAYGATVAWTMPLALMILVVIFAASMSDATRMFHSNALREAAAKSITAGWRFIGRHPVLLPVMALDMFAVLFGGIVAVLPAYADQVLHTGSEGLGILRASPALGAIVTALFLALNPMRSIRASRLLWVITGFGICMVGLGLNQSFLIAVVLLVLSGAFDSFSMVMRSTLMQLLIPDDMRGRVSSVNSMFIISSNEIGAFRAGGGAALLGLVPSIIVGGMATLSVVAITWWRAPKLRTLVVQTGHGGTPPAA